MNTRTRKMMHSMKTPLKLDKEKMQKQGRKLVDSEKGTTSRRLSRRERKMALLQDVVMLKKKLQHEESVHRALERAFTRPLGALPRLPPYLPQSTLELLAEVAVLEEEVVRLEEQIVNFRQGLYEEAVHSATSKKIIENGTNLVENKEEISKLASKGHRRSATMGSSCSTQLEQNLGFGRSTRYTIEKTPLKRVHFSEDTQGKENQSCVNSRKNINQSPKQPNQRIRTPVKESSRARRSIEKQFDPMKMKLECRTVEEGVVEVNSLVINEERASEGDESNANKISEDLLKCLSSIFLRMSRKRNRNSESEIFYSLMQMPSIENAEGTGFGDPYGTCKECGERDIGPYKKMRVIEANSIDTNRKTNSMFLLQRLKLLLEKLASVDIKGLTHQQKLAFWINIYNSCMMNAFLEYGIPESPQKVISLLQKAMINVGGQSLNAMTIEHFILRLPHHSESTNSKGDNHEKKKQSNFGLEWSEPLVTFALSCGSWSSPAVRVYTPSQIENELEAAKKDYLQAAVGISSSNKLVIPKLLDWYLLDFAKDLESLVDWICLQLPDDLRNNAIRCLGREKGEPLSQSVQVMPYEFHFRYLIFE